MVTLSLARVWDRAFPWACYSRPTSARSILLRDSSSSFLFSREKPSSRLSDSWKRPQKTPPPITLCPFFLSRWMEIIPERSIRTNNVHVLSAAPSFLAETYTTPLYRNMLEEIDRILKSKRIHLGQFIQS